MKYDVVVMFEFKGVEARNERHAESLCDAAVGAAVVPHPTTSQAVGSETAATGSE